MERTFVPGNMYLYFSLNMNKDCVPLIYLFLCTLVHWHARAFIFFVAQKNIFIFLSKHLQVDN